MEPDKKSSLNISPKEVDFTSFFDRETNFIFIYKKTEKLASATYIITNLFPENEPMKRILREKASELLSFSLALAHKESSGANQTTLVYGTKTKVIEMTSLFEISFRGGLVSAMNLSILKSEFYRLVEALENSSSLPNKLLQDAVSEIFFTSAKGFEDKKEHDKFGSMSHTKNTIDSMSFMSIKDRSRLSLKDNTKRTNRREAILSLLKKKGELTIKDISGVIKDCSEKTIQRELISFISAGVLRRTGQRRWSRYSLRQM